MAQIEIVGVRGGSGAIDTGMLLHRNFDMPIVDAMVTL